MAGLKMTFGGKSVMKTKRLSLRVPAFVCVCSMLFCNKVCIAVCMCVLSPSDLFPYCIILGTQHSLQLRKMIVNGC